MRGIQEFITGSIHAMIDYIVVVSTVDLDQASHTSKPSVDSRERLRLTNTLHQRIATAPTLHREATPLLPHLLDVPKHLAIVTSLIVRYSRSHSDRFAALDSMSTEDNHLRELCSRCLEVEDRALHRVSRLAVKPKHHSKSQKRTSDPMITTVSINENYESPIFTSRERKISTPGRPLRGKRSARPSTAPSPTSRSGVSIEPLMPPSPVSLRQITSTIMPTSKKPYQENAKAEDKAAWTARPPPSAYHPRSTSTDSTLHDNAEGSSQVANNSASDNSDDQGKKRRGLLRGIWGRK